MKANMRTNRTRVHFMYRVCFDIPYLATGSIRHRSILSWMILVSRYEKSFGNDLICDSLAFDKYQDFYPYKLMITRRRTGQPTLLKIIQVGGGGWYFRLCAAGNIGTLSILRHVRHIVTQHHLHPNVGSHHLSCYPHLTADPFQEVKHPTLLLVKLPGPLIYLSLTSVSIPKSFQSSL